MPENENNLVRIEVIAKFVGISVRRIQQLTQEDIIQSVKPDDGKPGRMYDFLPTIRGLLLYYKEKADKRKAPTEALNEVRLATEDVKLRMLEAKAAIEEGNAHSIIDVKRVWNDIMGAFRMQLHSFPYVAADKFVELPDRDTAHEVLEAEIRSLTGLLVQYDPAAFYARNPDYEEMEAGMSEGEIEESISETAV